MLQSLLKTFALFCFTSIFLFPITSIAAEDNKQPSFEEWIERLKQQALSKGISLETINKAFLDVQQTSEVANFERNIPNQILDQYLAFNLAPRQIDFQKQLLARYNSILFEIGHLFGVEPEVLIAVWTIDNLDSRDKKSIKAIDLLVTSTYKQPRNKNLRAELFHALKLIEDGQVNPAEFMSDESGLLGTIFFKPSMLRNYGIDYDGDGLVDIWKNYADIFASTANYLSSIGWKNKERWGLEVVLPEDFAPEYFNMNVQRSVNQWHALGVRITDGSDLPMDSNVSSLIRPDDFSAKDFLVQDNYFALLRWKRSPVFAIAVGLMTNLLKPEVVDAPSTPFLGPGS